MIAMYQSGIGTTRIVSELGRSSRTPRLQLDARARILRSLEPSCNVEVASRNEEEYRGISRAGAPVLSSAEVARP